MNINELVNLLRNRPLTQAEVEDINKRLNEAEAIFEKESRERKPSEAWYNRRYDI